METVGNIFKENTVIYLIKYNRKITFVLMKRARIQKDFPLFYWINLFRNFR
jgi:hypothetical protein